MAKIRSFPHKSVFILSAFQRGPAARCRDAVCKRHDELVERLLSYGVYGVARLEDLSLPQRYVQTPSCVRAGASSRCSGGF